MDLCVFGGFDRRLEMKLDKPPKTLDYKLMLEVTGSEMNNSKLVLHDKDASPICEGYWVKTHTSRPWSLPRC